MGMIDPQKLREFRKAKGFSQAKLGKAAGGSQQLVGHLESGAVRSTTLIYKIADVLGVPPPLIDPEIPSNEGSQLVIPIVSNVSAGALMQPDISDEQIGVIRVGELDPHGDWLAMRVDGDSMDRVSPPGSIILVNRKEKRLVPNACYVFSNGDDGVTYKRFRPNPDRLEPVSTNPNHEPIFFEHEPTVIGRVRKTILDM